MNGWNQLANYKNTKQFHEEFFYSKKKKKDSNSQFIFQMVTKNLLRHDFISELVNEQDYKNWIQDIE